MYSFYLQPKQTEAEREKGEPLCSNYSLFIFYQCTILSVIVKLPGSVVGTFIFLHCPRNALLLFESLGKASLYSEFRYIILQMPPAWSPDPEQPFFCSCKGKQKPNRTEWNQPHTPGSFKQACKWEIQLKWGMKKLPTCHDFLLSSASLPPFSIKKSRPYKS